MKGRSRRAVLREIGLSSAVLPFVNGLSAFGSANGGRPKKRLIFLFTPNGTIASKFWPRGYGRRFELNEITAPLERHRNRTLFLAGIENRVKGPGGAHVRGIGSLLTGVRLSSGNITFCDKVPPAGWATGISLDQELKRFLQSNPATRTAFGSLEFGAGVPDRADPFTRLSYRGKGEPVAPVRSPYEMYRRLYGRGHDHDLLVSVLDESRSDLKQVAASLGRQDRDLLERHESFVRDLEVRLQDLKVRSPHASPPELRQGIPIQMDQVPQLTRLQMDLLVNSLVNDFTRIATFQFSKASGEERMEWLGIREGHHSLSHEPDGNLAAQADLVRINRWYCEQVAHLADQLAETPDPSGDGHLLDHTTIVWLNELSKGNTHDLVGLPVVLIGNGCGFRMGRHVKLDWKPRTMDTVFHHRLLLTLAHSMGHRLETFGQSDLCAGGPLDLNSYTVSELSHDGPVTAGAAGIAGVGGFTWRRRRRKAAEKV